MTSTRTLTSTSGYSTPPTGTHAASDSGSNTQQQDERDLYADMADSNPHYSVLYDAEDHWSVLTQMYGSLWPRVLPYCIANVTVMIMARVIKEKFWPGIEISSQGHTFISVVVGFLLVSRVQTVLAQYAQARTSLATMYRATRELIMDACVLTQDNKSDNAKRWRYEVAYRTLLLLRTSMAVIDYPTDFIASWKVPELQGEELEDILKHSLSNPELKEFRHEARSEFEESMRVPIRMSYLLKKSLQKQNKMLLEESGDHVATAGSGSSGPLATSHYISLMKNVDEFMNGYYGMRKFLTTPIPFPLVQMARTFLFAYVFTIPFAFLSDDSPLWAHCFEVFLLTYGFVGLELVSIELDNPFGDDENDFDNLALAKSCMEDVYLIVYDTDGYESARALRQKMSTMGQKQRNRVSTKQNKNYQSAARADLLRRTKSKSNLEIGEGSVTFNGSDSCSSNLSDEITPLVV
jgi:predicted membrane chloride channel (bestrophin family)